MWMVLKFPFKMLLYAAIKQFSVLSHLKVGYVYSVTTYYVVSLELKTAAVIATL